MKKNLISLIFTISLIFPVVAHAESSFWQIQSVDTMKYSRDLAREKASDPSFTITIESQVKNISDLGATHVAIGTPYDEEFVPFLTKWVTAARKNNLKVWFRGNFSGWEGWFDYPKISTEDHPRLIREFITKHPDLFEDGDIFTPCPECENGGPGDPRSTGDIEGFRNMLIGLREHTIFAFHLVGKKVTVGYFSMNGDVAKLAMDKVTTQKLGGVVTIDHYVKDPEKLNQDVTEIAEMSGGKILLGEIGAPIPDIHGAMTESEQNAWVEKTLSLLSNNHNVIGLNYWVLEGGTTGIQRGIQKYASSDTLSSYFKPKVVTGTITDELRNPVQDVNVAYDGRSTNSNEQGSFKIYLVPNLDQVIFTKTGFKQKEITISENIVSEDIVLIKTKENLLFKIQKFFAKISSLFTRES